MILCGDMHWWAGLHAKTRKTNARRAAHGEGLVDEVAAYGCV